MNAHARISDDAWADEQVGNALRVLSDHHAREWEASRSIREASIRQRIAEWQEHEAGCIRRAKEYAAQAASLPAAHKDHPYYTKLANDQFALAARARRAIEAERTGL